MDTRPARAREEIMTTETSVIRPYSALAEIASCLKLLSFCFVLQVMGSVGIKVVGSVVSACRFGSNCVCLRNPGLAD